MLKLTLFTPKTLTPRVIKSLQDQRTVCLVLFEHGRGREGIKKIIQEYRSAYPGAVPELLTFHEGSLDEADRIQSEYELKLAKGTITFVDEYGNLMSDTL